MSAYVGIDTKRLISNGIGERETPPRLSNNGKQWAILTISHSYPRQVQGNSKKPFYKNRN